MQGYHTSLPFRSNDHLRPIHSAVRKLATEESHEVGDYGLLHKAVSRQINQRRKKKKKQQSFSDCLSHCHSLDKLQLLHQEKNEEIKRHIYEKAQYQAQTQELKQQIINPTMREHKLHLKIAQLEQQNRILKQQLEKKQSIHRQELQMLKGQHKIQLDLFQQTQNIANQQNQYRLQSTIANTDIYRNIEPTNMNLTGSRAGTENRSYITQNQPTINKPEPASRVQVVTGGANQQPTRTYVAGSPVYISSNRQQQAKPPIARTLSPYNSKNTTSQTQIYRGDSPKIITHTYGNAPTTGQNNRIERIEISRQSSNTRQEHALEPMKPNQGITMSKQNPPFTRTTLQTRPAVGLSYGENDLQEIYKKYCIND